MSLHDEDIDLFEAELRLCGVHEGEIVAVVSQADERLERSTAFLEAAGRLGASPFHVRLPAPSAPLRNEALSDAAAGSTLGVTQLDDNPAAIEALKRADLVIDLIFLLFSKEQFRIRETGTRILTCIEPVDTLRRLLPTPELRQRVEVAQEMLAAAESLRVTSPHGTDVTYKLGVYPAYGTYGYVDTPGRWDHWPGGLVYTGGADDGVDGTVVIGPGDIVFPFKFYVRDRLELTIRSGRIEQVSGGYEAGLLSDYMESFKDPRAYGISHIGWGLNENASWSALAIDSRGMGMDSRVFNGNVLFSTGPNQEVGGTNDTQCHVDVPMRGCSVFLDDKPVVVDGQVVVEEMKPRVTADA